MGADPAPCIAWKGPSCQAFKLAPQSVANVEVFCNLAEQVAHLHPELIQGAEKLFQLGVLFDQAEVERFQQKQKDAASRPFFSDHFE